MVHLERVLKAVQSLPLLYSSAIRPRLGALVADEEKPNRYFNRQKSWAFIDAGVTKKGANFLSGNYTTMLSSLNIKCGVNISSAETWEKSNTN